MPDSMVGQQSEVPSCRRAALLPTLSAAGLAQENGTLSLSVSLNIYMYLKEMDAFISANIFEHIIAPFLLNFLMTLPIIGTKR